VKYRILLPVSLSLLFGLLVCGCSSTSEPGSSSFASVTIAGRTPDQIIQATEQVFREDGFAGGATGKGDLLFQKEGSRMSTLKYEGIWATTGGSVTLYRAKCQIIPLGGDSFRLQCQAFVVRNSGDPFFEDEQRLTNVRSGHYKSLLKKVAERLK
jgi:hypothetical protein